MLCPFFENHLVDVDDFLGWFFDVAFAIYMINRYYDNNWIDILIKVVFNGKVTRKIKEKHW